MDDEPRSGATSADTGAARPDAGAEASRSEHHGQRPSSSGAAAPDDPVYVISVAAKLVGLPAWTLRVLDEQGIVSPKRTDKNRRLYSDRDVLRLSRVRTLTEIDGVNMNGVRLILRLEDERDAFKGE